MNPHRILPIIALLPTLTLVSCSGHKSSACTTNCPAQNATISLSVFDAPTAGVTFLSFTLAISGVSLIPASGNEVSLFSPTSNADVDLVRMQTDSALLTNSATVAAGTYTGIKVAIAPSSGVFFNASGAAVGSCAAGAVCSSSSGGATAITYTFATPLILVANQTQWIGLDFNLNNAITTSGGMAIDFSQPNVMTATTTPRIGLPSNALETIEDFIGVVTSLSPSSLTVQSGITGGSVTAAIGANTTFDTPAGYSGCGTATAATCLALGSTVSLDATLGSGGVFTATEIDVLDAKAAPEEIEGVIYPTATSGIFGMILADKVVTDGNTALAGATYGSGIFLTISPTAAYAVDTKTLSVPLNTVSGFPGSGLIAGQVIRAQLNGATSASNGISATATNVLLRWSRLTGTLVSVNNSAGFFVSGLPAYVYALNPVLNTTSAQVNTYLNYTAFDGVTGTTDTSFATGKTVAIRALYLNNVIPPFQAAKVRVP